MTSDKASMTIERWIVVGLWLATCIAGCGTETAKFDEMITCNCPNDKRPSKSIPRWKYDRVRTEILGVLPAGDAGMEYPKLREQVIATFSQADTLQIGNLTWYVDTVTLHLETLGQLTREADSRSPLPKQVKRE